MTEWKWKNEKLEEVREFKYLGFNFKTNNEESGHLREIVSIANKVIGMVWGIGEKLYE